MDMSAETTFKHPEVVPGDTAQLPEQFLEAMHCIVTSELHWEGGGDEQYVLGGADHEETRKRQSEALPRTVEARVGGVLMWDEGVDQVIRIGRDVHKYYDKTRNDLNRGTAMLPLMLRETISGT